MAMTFKHEHIVNDKDITETYSIGDTNVSEETYNKLLGDYTDTMVYKKPASKLKPEPEPEIEEEEYDLEDVVDRIKSLKKDDAIMYLAEILEGEFESGYDASTVDTLRNNADLLNQIANEVENFVYE
jgi:hypothetical protein